MGPLALWFPGGFSQKEIAPEGGGCKHGGVSTLPAWFHGLAGVYHWQPLLILSLLKQLLSTGSNSLHIVIFSKLFPYLKKNLFFKISLNIVSEPLLPLRPSFILLVTPNNVSFCCHFLTLGEFARLQSFLAFSLAECYSFRIGHVYFFTLLALLNASF